VQKEIDLQYLTNLRERREQEGKKEWIVSMIPYTENTFMMDCQSLLRDDGFEDDTKLDEAIKKLENGLKRARKKEAEGDDHVVGIDS
jgi:actin-related protein 5